ncbi:MAG: hypothetical protein FJX77_05645, partial [Armatimonadetes bacterium]|nr:hypothetical protein [Armatimonadota bacterium]
MASSRFWRQSLLWAALPAVGLLSGCFSLTINSQSRPREPQREVVRSLRTTALTGGAVRITERKVRRTGYDLNLACPTSPDLSIRRVEISPVQTVVTLVYAAVAEAVTLHTPPPGDAEAFYIRDGDSTREYRLQRVEGLPTGPDRLSATVGKPVEFRLYLEPLDPDVRR